jgi:anti-sigma factor RsiW
VISKLTTYNCEQVRSRLSSSLDGTLTGREMQRMAAHTQLCGDCKAESENWSAMQQALTSLGQKKAPADLGLRLRVAISQARSQTVERRWQRWQMRWENSVRPLALQWSAGLASAMVVLAAMGLLVGVFAAPQAVQAASPVDEPVGMASAPHFLYSPFPSYELATDVDSAVVVEAFIGADGRVYDYKILAGEDSPRTHAQLNNQLYFSVFAPARVFGQPVRGHVVLAYDGVAVKG